jgi:hypothetical protein
MCVAYVQNIVLKSKITKYFLIFLCCKDREFCNENV